MYLENISLKNFRNYSVQTVSFHPDINILFGSNAQGKTNLLEAIYYLCTSRSARTNNDQELIKKGSNFFFIKGSFRRNESNYLVETGYQYPQGVKIKLNSKEIKRSAFIHQIPVVIFCPEDILLLKEGPALRRRFLNLEGSRLNPLYYTNFKDYFRALQQRNRLLKEHRHGILDPALLEPWDQELVKLGAAIIRMRIAMLKDLEQQSFIFFNLLTGALESLSIMYQSSIDYQDHLEHLEDSFRLQLKKNLALDQKRGYTSVGPHLDDFSVAINGLDARKFASQGQQRTAVLALKMGELALFKQAGGAEPIVLLDDVFSEFDQRRQQHLFTYLSERDGQSFITTAVKIKHFETGPKKRFNIFTVCKGKIDAGSRLDY